MSAVHIAGESLDALRRKIIGLAPTAAAMLYPFVLKLVHLIISSAGSSPSRVRLIGASSVLVVAFLLPLSGLASAHRLSGSRLLLRSDLHARRLAFASIAAPPLFVFVGVARGLLRLHVPEMAIWIGLWALVGLYG